MIHSMRHERATMGRSRRMSSSCSSAWLVLAASTIKKLRGRTRCIRLAFQTLSTVGNDFSSSSIGMALKFELRQNAAAAADTYRTKSLPISGVGRAITDTPWSSAQLCRLFRWERLLLRRDSLNDSRTKNEDYAPGQPVFPYVCD